MESHLIPLWPLCDTFAFSLLIWPVFARFPKHICQIPVHYTELAKLALYLVIVLYIHRSVIPPSSRSNNASDNKAAKKTSRRRIPSLWMVFLRFYIKLAGGLFSPSLPQQISYIKVNANNTIEIPSTVSGPNAAAISSTATITTSASTISTVSRSPLRLIKSMFSSKSSSHTHELAWVYPKVKYIGPNQVGFLFPQPSKLEIYLNKLPWTQVYVCDEQKLVIIYGLSASTLYDLELHYMTSDEKVDKTVRDANSNSSAAETDPDNYITLTFPISTACNKPPRRVGDGLYPEALKMVGSVLDNEKTKLRKMRKDWSKKQVNLKRDIDALSTKISSKRKSDERTRKRIQSLRDRVEQQRNEVKRLTSSCEQAALPTQQRVSELANMLEVHHRERESKQQGLEVSLRAWDELQRNKRKEVSRLRQRCCKLNERITKIKSDRAKQRSQASTVIMNYIGVLRHERKLRKETRLQLESDFTIATAKLLR